MSGPAFICAHLKAVKLLNYLAYLVFLYILYELEGCTIPQNAMY